MKLRKYLLAGLFFLSLNGVFAQTYIDPNQPMVDMKRLHFGFSVGLNTQNLMFTHNGLDQNGEKVYAEVPSYNPGFSVGLVSDLALTRYFNLRVVPSLHFGSKDVRYTFYDNAAGTWKDNFEKQEIKSNYLMLPVELKYSSLRLNNSRPYLLIGGAAGYDLSRKKTPDELIRLKPVDFYLELGVGCDFYFPYFKLNPELKFCFGLNNLLDKNRPDLENPENPTTEDLTKYTKALSKVTSRLVVLTFYFE